MRVSTPGICGEFAVCLAVVLAGFDLAAQDSRTRAQEFFRTAGEVGRGVAAPDAEVFRQKSYFYGKAVEADPSYAEAWNNLAYAQENLGLFEDALRSYRRAVELNSEMAVAHMGLGDVFSRCGRHKDAVDAYENALRARGLSIEDRRIVEDRVQAERSLVGVASSGVVPMSRIVGMLKPPMVVRGATIQVSPKISFTEQAIGFQYNSSVLLPQAHAQLEELAAALRELSLSAESRNRFYEVGGHTDARGAAEANYQLGLKRAEAVRAYIVKKYPDLAAFLVVRSYGKSALIYPAARTEDEHAVNRRVEIATLDAKPRSAGEAELSLTFSGFRRVGSNRVERIVSGKSVLYSGDRYQIYVRPSADCYVYAYQKDSKGRGTWIFPCKECGAANPVKAGTEYWFPRRDKYLQLDNEAGEETIYLLASVLPAADLEHAMETMDASGPAELLFTVRGLGGVRPGPVAKLVPPKPAEPPKPAQAAVEEIFGRDGALHTKIVFKHASAARGPLPDSTVGPPRR